MQIINNNIYYKNLYVYKRDINEKYLIEFHNYEKNNLEMLNFNYMKKTINKPNFVDGIFNHLTPDLLYTLYHMKLITIDILTNRSFSFKCLKTNIVFRTTKSFHKLLRNDKNITGGEYDDIIVYVFTKTPYPFVVGIGNGSYWGALHNQIHFVYYFKTKELYYFKENQLNHVEETKEEIRSSIVNYCENNNLQRNEKVCTMLGFQNNIGHAYWNDLSGFKFLLDMKLLKFIDLFGIFSGN